MMGIPEKRFRFRPWTPLRLWMAGCFITNCLALFLVSALEPAGFDRCEGAPSDEVQLVQAITAGVAAALCAISALWYLRGKDRAIALLMLVAAGICWLVLLGNNQSC